MVECDQHEDRDRVGAARECGDRQLVPFRRPGQRERHEGERPACCVEVERETREQARILPRFAL